MSKNEENKQSVYNIELDQVHAGDRGQSIKSETSDPEEQKPEESYSLWQMGMRFLGYGADEETKS